MISRDKQGLAEWAQVLIVREGIASWPWPVSLLGAGSMGVYIASPILRYPSIGRQDMYITCYDIMVCLIKDVKWFVE